MSSIQACDFASGSVAGFCGLLISHPIETLKVRQQILNENVFDIIQRAYHSEGLKGFYKGVSVTLLTATLTNTVYYGVFSNALRIITGENTKLYCETERNVPFWHTKCALAGAIGGASYSIVNCPIEFVKVRMQSNRSKKGNSISQEVANIYKIKGPTGFYRGLSAVLVIDITLLSSYPVTYSLIACGARKHFADGKPCVYTDCLAGGFTGIFVWLPLLPVDVIKSRMQADDLINPRYKGFIDCSIVSWRTHGFNMVFRGYRTGLTRAFLVNSISLPLFNYIVKYCN